MYVFFQLNTSTLIKKKIKYKKIQKGSVAKLYMTYSLLIVKHLRISSYIRKPFLINDFATDMFKCSVCSTVQYVGMLCVHFTCTISQFYTVCIYYLVRKATPFLQYIHYSKPIIRWGACTIFMYITHTVYRHGRGGGVRNVGRGRGGMAGVKGSQLQRLWPVADSQGRPLSLIPPSWGNSLGG
jgi:hypothetical protein